jgi:hypothetical protein
VSVETRITDWLKGQGAAFALLALPACLYLLSVALFSVNVPVGDDYTLLGEVVELRQAPDRRTRLALLLETHNEHRILVTRLVAYLVSGLPGGVDLRVLLAIGNAVLILALVALGRFLRFQSKWEWIVVAMIVLQPQLHKLMFYAQSNIQAYFGILWAVAYLHFTLQRGKEHVALAFFICAVLTSGSGLFLVVVGAVVLALLKRWRSLALHIAIAVPVWVWYLRGIGNAGIDEMTYALENPVTVARFFVGTLGSVAEIPWDQFAWRSSYTTIACGVVLFAYFGSVAWRTAVRTPSRADMAVFAWLLYCTVLVVVIAIQRSQEYEDMLLSASLDGRYRIYGLMIAALCVVDVLRRLSPHGRLGRAIIPAAVACVVIFNIVWYVHRLDTMRDMAASRQQALQIWLATGDASRLPSWDLRPETAAQFLSLAIRAGVFRPDTGR